jgi:hypothetical protein
MAEKKEVEKDYMVPKKLDTVHMQVLRGTLKPESAFKPEPEYRIVADGLRKKMEEAFKNPTDELRINCCIEGCCVSWCCIQIS